MTAVMGVEQQRARYAQAREALWGKPRVINRVVEDRIAAAEEKLAIEEYRKAERERWEQRQRELSTQSTKVEPSILDNIVKSGTSGRFCIENTVSYWCFDAIEPTGVKAVRDMKEIAIGILAGHPGITLENVKGPERRARYVGARKAIATAIREQRPDLSTTQIGRFLNRDHTTVLNLLGRVKLKGGG
jgi:hypothetical protein